jgi:hypothetical protein
MTRKEFEKLRLSIEEENFFGNYANPIDYGIQRAAFEKRKFQKLISVARKVDFKTTRAKAKQWKRQLDRAEQSYERFKGLRKEIEAAKLQVRPAPISPGEASNRLRP